MLNLLITNGQAIDGSSNIPVAGAIADLPISADKVLAALKAKEGN